MVLAGNATLYNLTYMSFRIFRVQADQTSWNLQKLDLTLGSSWYLLSISSENGSLDLETSVYNTTECPLLQVDNNPPYQPTDLILCSGVLINLPLCPQPILLINIRQNIRLVGKLYYRTLLWWKCSRCYLKCPRRLIKTCNYILHGIH